MPKVYAFAGPYTQDAAANNSSLTRVRWTDQRRRESPGVASCSHFGHDVALHRRVDFLIQEGDSAIMQLSASPADFAARRGRCVVATVSAEDNDVGGEGTKTVRLKRNRDLEAVVGKSGGGIRRACQVIGYDAVTELLVLCFHAPGFSTLATKHSANSFAMRLGTWVRSLEMRK